MPSYALDSTHDRTTWIMQCHNIHWTIHTIGQRIAWHVIIAIGKHTQSDDVSLGISSLPMYYTNGWTMWGETWLNRPWTTHTVRQCRPWNFIIAHGPPIQSNKVKAWHACVMIQKFTYPDDVGRCMPSWHLDMTQGRTMSGVEYHPHDWMTLSMSCHHRSWTAYTNGQC